MPKQKSHKRANGEGTFYQLPDKSWVHQITLGRKPDGSPNRKSFKGKTRAACIERRDAYLEEQERREAVMAAEKLRERELYDEMEKLGHPKVSEILFSEAFPHWLKLFKSPPTKKATTYSGYLNTYEVHFEPFFGALPLYQITLETVQEYYNRMQRNGSRRDGKSGALSAKTVCNHHMILKDFFSYAVERYQLPSNPTLKTQRPDVPTPKMRVLDPDEMSVFLHEVMRETQRTAILFALFTGLRMGHASVSTTERYVTTMPQEMRKAVEQVAAYCDPSKILEAKKLNGAKDRLKYSDVLLPTWLQTEPVGAHG